MNAHPVNDDRFPWEEEDPPRTQTAHEGKDAPAPLHASAVEMVEPAVASPPEDFEPAAAEAAPSAPSVPSAPVEEASDAEPAAVLIEREAPSSSRPVAPKEYYAISEVCDLVGLKPHVLRYWETQFQVLNPSKNRSGNRVYQRKEIKLILLVKHLLYEEKYTVDGARAKLDRLRRGGNLQEATSRILDAQMIELLRGELVQLRELLTPPPTG